MEAGSRTCAGRPGSVDGPVRPAVAVGVVALEPGQGGQVEQQKRLSSVPVLVPVPVVVVVVVLRAGGSENAPPAAGGERRGGPFLYAGKRSDEARVAGV